MTACCYASLSNIEYLRIYIEHQEYSTHNKADKIHVYAERRNIQNVRTYANKGTLASPIW